MANQFLSLALFLMLLSFFIVMNSVSSFDDTKSAPVMNSLIVAFSNRIPDTPQDPSPTPTPLVAVSDGDTLSNIEGIFSAHIGNFQATRNRLGTVMHVRASVDQFEKAINIPGFGDYNDIAVDQQGAFAQTMVTLMRSENNKQPYRVDIVLNTQDDPAIMQNQSPENFTNKLKRVGGFAKILEDNGLPRRMMSVGLNKGNPAFIDLYFYKYEPFDVMARIKEEKRRNGAL